MTKKIVLLLGLALLGSCSKEHANLEQPQTEVAMGTPATLELEAGLSLSFGSGDESPVDELNTDEGQARMLDVYQRADKSFAFDIDIERYKDKKMHLFLRQEGSRTVTSILAPVTLTQLSSGKYSMRIVMEQVKPVGATDFASGNWFITGFWGGGDQSEDATNTQHAVANVSPTSPDQIGDKVKMDIPLGFPWTRIVSKKKGAVMLLKHEQLKIQPMGILFSLLPNNRTVYDIELDKLDKELQGFAIGGYFDAAAEAPVEGKFPSFNKGFDENLASDGPPVLPYNIPIASGKKSDKPIYLWAIPTEDKATDYLMSFTFMGKERTSDDTDIPVVDRFNKNGTATFTDRYTIDYSFKKKPKHSQYFVKEMKIRTSPMITEYFINRVRNGQSYTTGHYNNFGNWVSYVAEAKRINHPYFYGYVEIYNPNLDGISLENYALCRIANIRDVKDEYSGERVYGKNFPYFHPMAREKFSATRNTGSGGTADRNADKNTESHKALLLSLQLKDGARSSFQTNSLGFKSRFETDSKTIEVADESELDRANDSRIEHVKFFKGKPTGKAILRGGKTMLVLGNGFINTQGETGGFTFWNGTAWVTTYQKDNTLAKIADPRVTPLPQNVYDKILKDDECQMVVAVDNFLDKSTNPGSGTSNGMPAGSDYYSIFSGAGVMNLGWHDALFIVQKHKSNGKRRRIVDATSANPFGRKNNWTEFAAKVTLASESDTGWPHFRVRTVAQHLPEFLNFTEKQWYPVYYREAKTGKIPSKTSPGRRSAQGFSSYF